MGPEEAFHRRMLQAADQCKREFGYNPTYWVRMIAEHGAVEAAKRLLRGARASDGFTRLWEEGRLDLSVEFCVLLPEYALLFTDDECAEARRRLELYEFDVDEALRSRHVVEARPPLGDQGKPEAILARSEEVPEAPVVMPVAGPEKGIWPTLADLDTAHQLFGQYEPRDVFYRAATDLVRMVLAGESSVTLSEALAVLLQTWNRAYYQYRSRT